jgi:lipid II:glycine glycyltransferase (peptidoglycan interpeptide bridge formation enzyme)
MSEKEFNPTSLDSVLSQILTEQQRTNRTLEEFMRQHEDSKARITKLEFAYQRVLGMAVAISAVVSLLGHRIVAMVSGGSSGPG